MRRYLIINIKSMLFIPTTNFNQTQDIVWKSPHEMLIKLKVHKTKCQVKGKCTYLCPLNLKSLNTVLKKNGNLTPSAFKI